MQQMQLSKEQQSEVLKNMALVKFIVRWNFFIRENTTEYDDIFSVGTIGLIKAVITFNPAKAESFGMYASVLIRNEISMYIKKTKKYEKDISIDELSQDYEGKGKGYVVKEIEHPKSDFVKEIILKDEVSRLVSIILNRLEKEEKYIILYQIAGRTQTEIAEIIGSDQTAVSRKKIKIINRIKEMFDEELNQKEIYTVKKVHDNYQISFSTKDVKNFNKVFAKILQEEESINELPKFNVKKENEQVIIQVPIAKESFSFIAEIMQEIDDFHLQFNPNKPKIKVKTQHAEKVKKHSSGKSKEEPNCEKGVRMNEVITYISGLERFMVEDLKEKFIDFNVTTIHNALAIAKKKGIIVKLTRGQYRVNKN